MDGPRDPELIVAEHIENDQFPAVYSSAGVVLNDHWRTMQTWGFVSNRLFDVLACGTPVISDTVPGSRSCSTGRSPSIGHDQLRSLVEAALRDPTAARRGPQAGASWWWRRTRSIIEPTSSSRALDRYM